MEAFVQPPSMANLKEWIALNLKTETLTERKIKPVHNYCVIPLLKENHQLTAMEMYAKIEDVVCSYYKVNLMTFNMSYKCRKDEYILCRQLSHYFIRKKSRMSFALIGLRHNKDHATVLHSIKCINARLFSDKNFKREFAEIEMSLNKYVLK